MTKKTAHRAAESDLQAFMTEAAARFKPDATVLAARINTAVQRYTATSTTQRLNAPAPWQCSSYRNESLKVGGTISAFPNPFTLPVREI